MNVQPEYDVVIMGGGPAGSTLGALLRRNNPGVRVAIFDQAVFPREHIGESFAHPVTSAIEQSGALAKVLASDCYVRKYGGIYNWDEKAPSVTMFEQPRVASEGVYRWVMHADRAEFDHILLDHAASTGVDVFQGTEVTRFRPAENGCVLTLGDGREVRAKVFADASGRHDSIATGKKRTWLSDYRNIAIWNHYYGGKLAQNLPGDWNVFRKDNLSPIACCAFEDGWFWHIPIRKLINGRRHLVHSIGMVTDPSILKQPGRDYTDPKVFMECVKRAPMIKDLVQDIEAVDEEMLTITNYSMINERFCDYDGRWLLVGDSAFFVDPLFSSGVAFATAMAVGTELLIRKRLEGKLPEQEQRDMWKGFDADWHVVADTYGLLIDQWYHAIAKNNPKSVYWNSRGRSRVDLDAREASFQGLVDTTATPDLLFVLTRGSLDVNSLDKDGPFLKAQGAVRDQEPSDDTPVAFAPDVAVREGYAVAVPGFKGRDRFGGVPKDGVPGGRDYWINPIANSDKVAALHAEPDRCHRFHFKSQPDAAEIKSFDEYDGGLRLWRMLQEGPVPYGKVKSALTTSYQLALLRKLLLAKMVVPAS